MRQGRDGGEQLGLDVLARDEQLDRLDPGGRRRLDQILALDGEEPELLALALLREELADELQRRVRRRGDQALRRLRGLVGGERGLRLLDDRGERGRIGHGQIGEHLAVELDPGLVQPRDELVVGHPVGAGGRVDADDPELPERPLLVLAVAVGVDERVLDLLLRVAVAAALEAPVALRWASPRTLRRFLRAWTDRLTRGIYFSPSSFFRRGASASATS